MTKLKILLHSFIAYFYQALGKLKFISSSNCTQFAGIEDFYFKAGVQKIDVQTAGILIYAATIGELKATSVFLKKIQQKWPADRLILIPGQPQYAKVFSDAYPEALVMHQFPSIPSIVSRFFRDNPVRYCVFVEGPSLHGFFPIRQDMSLPVGCLSRDIPIVVINACLYKKQIHSRIDLIEHKLFSGLFRKAVKHWYAPNTEIARDLELHDVPKDKIIVVGDIKFDNVYSEGLQPCSVEINEYFRQVGGKSRFIVAGSVNALEEQKALVSAWEQIRKIHPDIILIIAPRYVNDKTMMDKLSMYLEGQDIDYAMRSQGSKAMSSKKLIVVDTFGELSYFYQQADIAFAGRGHGVLEPMKYSKPVVVGPYKYWTKENSTSYLLYQGMRDNSALIECSSYEELSSIFLKLLEDKQVGEVYVYKYTQIIRQKMGGSDRAINHMKNVLGL